VALAPSLAIEEVRPRTIGNGCRRQLRDACSQPRYCTASAT
jgi:hypothetical protein